MITIGRFISDTLVLLIPTLFVAFVWLMSRVEEINYDGYDHDFHPWIKAWSDRMPEATRQPSGRWRWGLTMLLIPVYVIYLVNFTATPLLLRLLIAMIGIVVFGLCVYYCDKRLGK